MKLLVIRNSWSMGGAELYWIKLSDAFKKQRKDCKIYLITNNESFAELARSHSIKVYIINTFGEEVGTKKGLLRLVINLPHYIWTYLRIIHTTQKDFKADSVIFSGKTEKYVLTAILKIMKFRVIWLEHGQVFTPTMSKVALFIYKSMSHLANLILAEAHDTELDLLKNGIESNKIKYLGSGIDTEYFNSYEKKDRSLFTVGYVATIDWEKGIKEFLETAKAVCLTNKKINFIVAGDGPQYSWARRYVADNNLNSRIFFLGRVKNVRTVYEKINVLCAPINFRGALSLSLQEAMSMGVIPIVTDIGGNRELVTHKVSGYIFNDNYINHAREAIIHLSSNRTLQNKLSNKAREIIQDNFTLKALTSRWMSILMI